MFRIPQQTIELSAKTCRQHSLFFFSSQLHRAIARDYTCIVLYGKYL